MNTLPVFQGLIEHEWTRDTAPEVGTDIMPPGYAGSIVLESRRPHFSRLQHRHTMVLTWRRTCPECGDVFRFTTGLGRVRFKPLCQECTTHTLGALTKEQAAERKLSPTVHAFMFARMEAMIQHTQACRDGNIPFSFFLFPDEERLTFATERVTPQMLANAFVVDKDGFRRPTARDTMGHKTPSRTPAPPRAPRAEGLPWAPPRTPEEADTLARLHEEVAQLRAELRAALDAKGG